MTESIELKRQVVIQASPEIVYSYLTDEAKMKEWFGEIVESDPRPGGIFHVGSKDGNDCRGEYVELVPHEKVVFTWGGVLGLANGESTVEILLQGENNATRLTLRHYNISKKPAADSFGEGWKEHALPLLKAVCQGEKPGGLCFESGHECQEA